MKNLDETTLDNISGGTGSQIEIANGKTSRESKMSDSNGKIAYHAYDMWKAPEQMVT